MRVSYRWLKEYVDIVISPEELGQILTWRGVSVEDVTRLNPGLSGVVVGRIVSIEPHPSADRLLVVGLNAGQERLTVVTGAPKLKVGDLVPLARPGAELPGCWRIEAADFRGVLSQGMLCSETELLEGKPHKEDEGVWVFPEEVAPGLPVNPGIEVAELLGLDDWVLELELTPNYASHCLSMLGVAREVAAITGGTVRLPEIALSGGSGGRAAGMISVEILDPELCPRYSARAVEGVVIGPSPLWMQNRIRAAGMRPISNVVDVTNYVMLEVGQPLHAFDYDRVKDGRITVRRAGDGEKMLTLDGQVRELDPSMLAICDPTGPVALAGVMGGLESEVSDRTTRILLESANFNNLNIRRTARNLAINSEASTRFVKGVDPNGTVAAADRAIRLIEALGGGRGIDGVVDSYPAPVLPKAVVLRPNRTNRINGLSLTAPEMAGCLQALGLETSDPSRYDDRTGSLEDQALARLAQAVPVPADPTVSEIWRSGLAREAARVASDYWASVAQGDPGLLVILPTRRPDLVSDIDLVEEVARVYGFDRIPATLPSGPITHGQRTPRQAMAERTRAYLLGAGLSEVVSYSLEDSTGPDRLRLPEGAPERRAIVLPSPLSEEQSQLRTTTLTSMLGILGHNASRRMDDLAVFEIGPVYLPSALPLRELPGEPIRLALAASGVVQPKAWNRPRLGVDFYYLKGVVEGLLEYLGLREIRFDHFSHPSLHPGRGARVLGQGRDGRIRDLGFFGELHPAVARAYDIDRRSVAGEFDWEAIAGLALDDEKRFQALPRFPAVERDLALVVGASVSAERVLSVIRFSGGELLREARLFDLYQGHPVPEGKKSLAYNLVYRSDERTLTDAEVEEANRTIREALVAQIGAELRS